MQELFESKEDYPVSNISKYIKKTTINDITNNHELNESLMSCFPTSMVFRETQHLIILGNKKPPEGG